MINVVDSIMGSGKTSYIIQMLKKCVNESCLSVENLKYLVATPYLEQIKKIKNEVPESKEPSRTGETKSKNLLRLLQDETGIVICTHELLKNFSEYELLKPYTLIFDESPDVIELMSHDGQEDDTKAISIEDIQILKDGGYTKESEDGFLEWISGEYKGIIYTDIYKYIKNSSLVIKDNNIFKLLPTALFSSCKETYIFTYLFEGQNMYYYCKYFNIPLKYFHIIKNEIEYQIKEGKRDDIASQFPICIYEGKLNEIGETGLSKNWYQKKATEKEIKDLKCNIYNYLRNDQKAKVSEVIWTTFKQYSEKIAQKNDKLKLDKKDRKGKTKQGNFVACSTRATNDYKGATIIVYAVNRFQKPEIMHFFNKKDGIKYNEDLFALQEMLQFVWRSAIREGNQIYIYIPAKRMREMLINWLKYASKNLTEKSVNSSVDCLKNP